MSATAFDARDLARRTAVLDTVPAGLYAEVVTHPLGTLWDRCAGIAKWHEALIRGALPDTPAWPPQPWCASVLEALQGVGLVRFCAGQQELVEAVIRSMLDGTARCIDALEDDVIARYRAELAAVRARVEDDRLSDSVRDALRLQCERAAFEERSATLDRELRGAWAPHVAAWSAIEEALGPLDTLLGRGWDLTRGILRNRGWLDLVALRRWMQQLPKLRALAEELGRLRDPGASGGAPVVQTIVEAMSFLRRVQVITRSPLVPVETRGITRGGDPLHMLSSEAVLLRHPMLRRLWRARWAERSLLSWYREGELPEDREVIEEGTVAKETTREGLRRGPMVLLVDTSGSMEGVPERVAKALALEVMVLAHRERRACHVIAFSGPTQLVEHTLAMNARGIEALLTFLTSSFHGGTDLSAPLAQAVKRLREEAWQNADLLLITDGEFPIARELSTLIATARAERGAKLHGVLVGSYDTSLRALCDEFHRFTDWELARG